MESLLSKIRFRKDKGLTIVETLLAIFIITMAITSIVGASIYSYSVNNRSVMQLQALNLAREAVEAARTQRDTTWLPAYAAYGRDGVDFCGDSSTAYYIGQDQYCYREYKTWVDSLPATCFVSAGCQMSFAVGGGTTRTRWIFGNSPKKLAKQIEFGNKVTFRPSNAPVVPFYRKVVFVRNTNAPYSVEHPEVIVTATVAWSGPLCTPITGTDPETAKNCKVVVEERLTNWKNF